MTCTSTLQKCCHTAVIPHKSSYNPTMLYMATGHTPSAHCTAAGWAFGSTKLHSLLDIRPYHIIVTNNNNMTYGIFGTFSVLKLYSLKRRTEVACEISLDYEATLYRLSSLRRKLAITYIQIMNYSLQGVNFLCPLSIRYIEFSL